jgi:hypothetical protein
VVRTFQPGFSQGHIDIIVIALGIEKGSDLIKMINVPALLSVQGEEIQKGGEFSERGISFSELRLLVMFNY